MSRQILGVNDDKALDFTPNTNLFVNFNLAAGSVQGFQNGNVWMGSENYNYDIQLAGQIGIPSEFSDAVANPAPDSNIYYAPSISYNNQGALRDRSNISDLGKFKSLEDAQHYLTTIKIASVLSNMTVKPLIEIIQMLNGTKEFGIHPFKELGYFCKKNNLDFGLLDSNNNVVVNGSSDGMVYGLTSGQTPVLSGPESFISLYGPALDEASSKYNPGSKSDILKFINKNSMIQLANGIRGTPTSIKGYPEVGFDREGKVNFEAQEKYSGVRVGLTKGIGIVVAQKTNPTDR